MAGSITLGASVVAVLFLFLGSQFVWNNDSSKRKQLVSLEEPASAKPTPEFVPPAKEYTASKTTQKSVPKKLLPIDEATQDPGFLQFRATLLDAINRRDAQFLIRALDKNIKLSFGGDLGVHRFVEMWNPYSPQSTIWKELGDVLRLGGTFGYAHYPRNTFWAPYVFGLSGQLDNFWDAVIVGNNVQVHTQPSRSSPVIAALSYDVVKLGPYDPNPVTEKIGEFSYPWKQIRLADQRTGYVYGRYVRSPLDYRAAFNKIDGAWKLTAFVKGD